MKGYFAKKADTAKRIIGLSELKNNTHYLKEVVQALWASRAKRSDAAPVPLESLGLAPEQLTGIKRTWTRILWVFLALVVLLWIYVVYATLDKDYATGMVAFALSLVCLAQAFKYHFWLFQLREGKLGCTFGEWLQRGFNASRSQT